MHPTTPAPARHRQPDRRTIREIERAMRPAGDPLLLRLLHRLSLLRLRARAFRSTFAGQVIDGALFTVACTAVVTAGIVGGATWAMASW